MQILGPNRRMQNKSGQFGRKEGKRMIDGMLNFLGLYAERMPMGLRTMRQFKGKGRGIQKLISERSLMCT
jgi:hypothetical protein